MGYTLHGHVFVMQTNKCISRIYHFQVITLNMLVKTAPSPQRPDVRACPTVPTPTRTGFSQNTTSSVGTTKPLLRRRALQEMCSIQYWRNVLEKLTNVRT